jgi:RNA-directed DNA polymerase
MWQVTCSSCLMGNYHEQFRGGKGCEKDPDLPDNGKKRPLGIPVIRDRAIQAIVKNALEPSWEAKFEGTSYGFRPGRTCQDAIMRIYNTVKEKHKVWVLDADISGCFDNINHEHLLKTIGSFPAKELIHQWLKAGYIEYGRLHETLTGTPQGGVISPLLANSSLHGMEAALNSQYDKREWASRTNQYAVTRYAADFVVLCKTEQDAIKAQETIASWLQVRGLQLSTDKTRIVHLKDGFDFLGFNIRIYPSQKTKSGWKTLIRPSRKSVLKIQKRLREDMLYYTGQNVTAVIGPLNPIIRGWANYFHTQVATQTFAHLDHFMFKRAVRFVKRLHPNKPRHWVETKYFGKRNLYRKDNWVFGDIDQPETYLYKFAWTKIQRHEMVIGTYSPDNPALMPYWEQREMNKIKSLLAKPRQLAHRQKGKCPLCGESLFIDEHIEEHHIIRKDEGGGNTPDNLVLLHLYCHQQVTAAQREASRGTRRQK